ncbi:zonadhesin isoform X2 [Manduca sexta]|uniref:TIL domain-containing protein n=1 Tax=Manduca sexta TaxID=7130 RepID=A0A921Z8S5_MANSE|nr:zonadhesin isoform X2 [Manduca sexta]KAG6453477.1 hypothetical protein O3G_MSEX008194 [Manduca sexta]
MARFIFVFIALSAILLKGYCLADCDDSDEESESTTQSPQKCGDNEVLDKCPVDCPSDNCPKSRYDDQSRCPKPKKCLPPACKCGFNSKRAANGTCISTRDCPPFKCNGIHEEYNPCPAYCPGEDCSQATPDGKCHIIGRIGIVVECKPACRCKKNYWRLNGICVPYDWCPNIKNTTLTPSKPTTKTKKPRPTTTTPQVKCGANEVLDNCPTDCPIDYCPKNRYINQTPCRKPKRCPPPRCKCRPNFRRASNGSCIPTRNCPAFECNRENEEYNSCPPYCPGENCRDATPDGKCHAKGKILIPVNCKPACRCKKNFWRLNGNCVPYNECPNVATTENPPETTEITIEPTEKPTTVGPKLTCGDDEIAVDCPDNCSYDYCLKNRNDGKLPCTQSDRCPAPACKCRFNYRRADNGSCIPARECPPFPCDGPNEEYNSCPPICPGEDCSQATPDGKCPIFGVIGIVIECKPACRCRKNYWRLDGKCVPYNQCPNRNDTTVTTEEPSTEKPKLKCGPSEIIDDCPVDCPINNCPKSEDASFKPCPRPKKCPPPACRCELGTHRLDNGSCVPIQDCPPFECPRPNEEYRACYPVSPGESCSEAVPDEYIEPTKKLTLKCKPACRCKENYWRLNGVCVPYEKCRKSRCPEHETEVLCKSACSENECPRREGSSSFACPAVCLGPGCACERNYSRASNGTCIPTIECPPFDCSARPNEMYVACPSCVSDSCEDIGKTRDSCSRWALIEPCTPACRCATGFNRNDDGVCVPTAQCPGICPKNEKYTDCAQRLCRPQNCSDVADDQLSFICEPDKTDGCDVGCVCIDGFLRADNGKCVAEEECPSTNPVKCSDPNEEYTDSKQTCPGDTCSALTSKIRCEDEAVKPGCVCKSGFRRQTVDGPCVLLCECKEMTYAPACQGKLD